MGVARRAEEGRQGAKERGEGFGEESRMDRMNVGVDLTTVMRTAHKTLRNEPSLWLVSLCYRPALAPLSAPPEYSAWATEAGGSSGLFSTVNTYFADLLSMCA